MTTASGNIGIDVNFGTNMTDSQNVITIGDDGDGTVLNATDRTYIGNIRGVTVGNADGVNVIIDSDGQLGTINSWCQFKKTFNRWIKPASHPGAQTGHVSLQEQDTKKTEGTPQFGLIAEDMAELSPDLVMRDKAGSGFIPALRCSERDVAQRVPEREPESRRTATDYRGIRVNCGLATERNGGSHAQLKEQAAQIQKVSAQLETGKPAPKVVVNAP